MTDATMPVPRSSQPKSGRCSSPSPQSNATWRLAEAVPFVMAMPKRPAASSVRRPAARGQKTA
jgi:hypothetical protein